MSHTPFHALAILALGLTLLPYASASASASASATAAAAAAASGASALPAAFSSPGARPAYGLLWLQIDPDDVSITLDGQYLDKDVWLISVPPGDHEIRVSKPGYRAQRSRFGISSGQNVRLDLTLLPD